MNDHGPDVVFFLFFFLLEADSPLPGYISKA